MAGLAAAVVRRAALTRLPPLTLEARLAMLPRLSAGLGAPLTLRVNAQHVPLVEAGSLADGAVGLGIVHAHLRLAQMEVMRRLAQGRVAEAVGPAGLALDELLRQIDFPRAEAASLGAMPAETRAVIQAFCEGIDTVIASAPPPPEFRLLGLTPEPFTPSDVFAVSRLCSADYTWRVWRTLAPLRREPDWADLWREVADEAADGEGDGPLGPGSEAADAATAFAPNGSNAYALAGTRTQTGKPLLAADPHLVIAAPSPWLIAGLSLPDLMVWGIMVPGLPIFGLGRNDWGAWAGTNLHASSSALVDVADETLGTRTETIPVRGRRPATRTYRESRFGPVVSDGSLFDLAGDTVALRWMGHEAGEDFSAFLALMRARDHDAFLAAVDRASQPGLTMVWAGADGDIAKAIACRLPRRPPAHAGDIVATPSEVDAAWRDFATARDLPRAHNPEPGFVVSANDEPEGAAVAIGAFFAAPHRAERLVAILSQRRDFTRQDLARLQVDTHLAPAHRLAAGLAERAETLRPGSPLNQPLAAWDGRFDTDSRGALAFALVAGGLVAALEAAGGRPGLSRHWRPFARLTRLVADASPEGLDAALGEALANAEAPFARHRTWGDLHRLRLAHPATRIPFLRGRLPTLDLPAGGSNETLMKSAHPFTRDVHATSFGANARFIADLSDPDETYAILLGGQDGWPNARAMFDMVGPFQRGDSVRLPRTPAAVAQAFPHRHEIAPASRGD